MKDRPILLTRRTVLKTVPLGIAGTVLLNPAEADAFIIGVLFRVVGFSWGSIIGAGIATTIVAAGAVQVARYGYHAMFDKKSSGSGGGSYSAYTPSGWKEFIPPEPIIINVSFKPEERIKGDVLRILAIEHDILKNDGIVLPRGGKLVIEADGKMHFADTKFRGYAYMQNNRDLSVWTSDHQHVLTRKLHDNKFHNLHHDSDDGRLALVSLLGDISHA